MMPLRPSDISGVLLIDIGTSVVAYTHHDSNVTQQRHRLLHSSPRSRHDTSDRIRSWQVDDDIETHSLPGTTEKMLAGSTAARM